MRALLTTAGERVELSCAVPWIAGVLTEGAAGQLAAGDGTTPDVRVTVERGSAAFDVTGWRVLTRGAWSRPGQVMISDACSSGLDLLVTAGQPGLEVVARWRPSGKGRAAAAVLRSRARLLLRAVLLQYPALWWSQQRGRAPLHASVCGLGPADDRTVLLAGPGGVGKSTLVHGELLSGAISTCDNLCVSDGLDAWGVVEPLRLPAEAHHGTGRRMPHGRREATWPRRADRMRPGRVVVLVRGGEPGAAPCDPALAARYLVAGTYMAGELRRYWAFAATLALGTGLGGSHPPVLQIADTLSTRLPCVQVTLGDRPGAPLRELLTATEVPA
ncbi:MAG: hypothetical protein JO345_16950 [Streptosporangiaceae bacterium]|nr:hypothetical protein [Streptosporangiaceae bacterium]